MGLFKRSGKENGFEKPESRKFLKFGSSIYGRVIFIIVISSLILFLSFSLIFRSVNERYLNTVIRQNGNNVGSIVQGSLYHSMLENDKSTLQNTLDIINTMPGIGEVNMYDSRDNLVYSSISSEPGKDHSDPDCKKCHANLKSMFPSGSKQYQIISSANDCKMSNKDHGTRHLLIHAPILNERSCYDNPCHAHEPTEKVLGSLIIKLPLGDLDKAVEKSSAQFFILATLTTLLLIIFLILFTRRKIKDPLNGLLRASTAVANGDRSTRVEINRDQLDDMRVVSHAFNAMLDNLQAATNELENWSQQLEYKVQRKTEELGAAQNELMHVERLASLGKLSSSVAHEINNPLSGILVYAKLIQKQLGTPDQFLSKRDSVLRHLKLIENEAKRCGDIVKGLLDFSKRDQENFEPKHLHDILQETNELVIHSIRIANISFNTAFEATDDLVFCSPNQIKQACIAMIVNASEAVTENGEILVRTSNPDAETIQLDIVDNGIGISAEDQPHIFEPFFSTKQNTSGIGLGLPIVHGIIQSHNGRIQVKSESGRGTTMSIFLPLKKN